MPFQMPPVTKNILIICLLIFLAQNTFGMAGEAFFYDYLALHSVHSDYFRIYQLVTHVFLHAGLGHLLFNLLAILVFGSHLELYMGSKSFLNLLFIGGLGAALFHLTYLYIHQQPMVALLEQVGADTPVYDKIKRVLDVPTVGISGVVFACMAAFAYYFPNAYLYVYFFLPIKAKWVVLIICLYELLVVFMSDGDDGVARLAHLGGGAVGWAMVYFSDKSKRKYR